MKIASFPKLDKQYSALGNVAVIQYGIADFSNAKKYWKSDGEQYSAKCT